MGVCRATCTVKPQFLWSTILIAKEKSEALSSYRAYKTGLGLWFHVHTKLWYSTYSEWNERKKGQLLWLCCDFAGWLPMQCGPRRRRQLESYTTDCTIWHREGFLGKQLAFSLSSWRGKNRLFKSFLRLMIAFSGLSRTLPSHHLPPGQGRWYGN